MKNQKAYSSKEFLSLCQEFIQCSIKRIRVQRNGKTISKETVTNYQSLFKVLSGFFLTKGFELDFSPISNKNHREFIKKKKHWHQFYLRLTDYSFNELDHFDNHVGSNIKLLKCVCRWIETEKGINMGSFYRNFHIFKDEIPIIVLQPEQLNFLISNLAFNKILPKACKSTKDFFVFGCSVGLRVGDMRDLKKSNLEIIDDAWYLNVQSKKTRASTRIKLPQYAIDIIKRNENKSSFLFEPKSIVNLNKHIKTIVEMAGWNHSLTKTRTKRGVPVELFRNEEKTEHYRFCDLVSSHTMRRTAITTLLSLGVDEPSVRKISGHTPGSIEFYRYVKFHQQNLDEKTDMAFDKLTKMS